jgi:Flp pilus assembly protein TadG
VGNKGGNRIVGLTRWRRSERPIAREGLRDRGQSLAEFALVAPIMVLIFAAAAQFALIFERQIGIENAVRDGARRAATYDTPSAASADVNGPAVWCSVFGSGGLLQSNIQGYDVLAVASPTVTYTDQSDASGLTSIRVRVSLGYRHPLFMPLITQIIDGIDGSTDNALAIATSSQFTVQNDATTSVTVGGSRPYFNGAGGC